MKKLELLGVLGLYGVIASLAAAQAQAGQVVPGCSGKGCIPVPIPVLESNFGYSGRAFGATTTVNEITTTVVDTGALSEFGRPPLSAFASSVSVPGLLTAGVISANTWGVGGVADSNAEVVKLVLRIASTPTLVITADFVRSEAQAFCDPQGAAVRGNATIENLVVGGTAVTVTGSANQVVNLPSSLGTLTIQETTRDILPNRAFITVNALHVSAGTLGDVIISGSQSDIRCNEWRAVNPEP
ncbi:MAG: choice-of-anchor P family protein [Oligoflexia bacterium]|nr:choice-of-anchor P family protein [Oligoflexia bacterium]